MKIINQIHLTQINDLTLIHQHVDMVSALNLHKIYFTSTKISSSTHIRSLQKGFQIEYLNEKFETFFAYFRTKQFLQFKGKLPFGLNANSTLRSTIFYLGEPMIKSKHMIQVIYENLGVGAVFQGHWEKDQSLIDYCYIFESNLKKKICSNCKKGCENVIQGCIKCQFISYCSKQCKDKHIGLHSIYCQQIDL